MSKWVVRKIASPGFGRPFYTYLSSNSTIFSRFQGWDELQDAMIFTSFFTATWHALKNMSGLPVRLENQPTNPWL